MNIYKKKKSKVLIIGFGSIGRKHFNILKKKNLEIKILSKQNINKKYLIKSKDVIKFNPDYVIISSVASEHLKHINFIENYLINKIVLIEKPLFTKYKKIYLKNNKYFVGYNLRFHPVIQYLKKKRLKPFFIQVNCYSFLPEWRSNIHYSKSNSAIKKKGGGVFLELSHEIDYLNWVFGKLKPINLLKKKISNLKTNVDDIFICNALINKKILCNISLNFFSKIKKREIFIYTKRETIHADLMNNKIEIIKNKNKKILHWKKFDILKTYETEHQSLLQGRFKNFCSIAEANEVLGLLKFTK